MPRWPVGSSDARVRKRVSSGKLGFLCASALSLSFHPMPFRITQESYRPRVSYRTMVGALPARSACKFQGPNGVDNGSCHETIGMSATRLGAPPRKSDPDEVATREGGWMCEKFYRVRRREKNIS